MSRTKPRVFQILSLSGGGYRGLHVAQILEIIESQINGQVADHFDLIAGTSIGGIIALGLAARIPAADIRKTLEELGPMLFPKAPPTFIAVRRLLACKGMWRKALHGFKHRAALAEEGGYAESAWYTPEPLARTLASEQYFGDRTMRDLKHPVIIPAVNYSSGGPKFFKTDHSPQLTFDRDLMIRDVALGTSAAPIYFPVHKIDDQRIVDGGLIANDPTQVAVHEAMMFFGVRPALYGDATPGCDDLKVLSIGTLSPRHFADASRPLNQGLIGWGTGAFDLAMSAQEAMAAYMIDKHMLPGKVIRLPSIDARPESAPGLADVTPISSEILRSSARNLAQNAFGEAPFRALFSHRARTLDEVRANITSF
ncbi:CBASS cGAMP-activated phospholipase [Polaromonas sp. UBA4122]|uniref:CBASS cGAMP-activated phospholipase n=1 Tax=Polaromonas sp. UBA4122 TaxID=1947074 RepID=UPI0025CF2FAD|nr:CBASS cGAMP-activated phospholipase [Polaromonas sp. UBA4122]